METITISIDGKMFETVKSATVASAVLNAGVTSFRISVNGENRAPLCGMGICYECRLTINGVRHEKSCQIPVREAMKIETDGND